MKEKEEKWGTFHRRGAGRTTQQEAEEGVIDNIKGIRKKP